LQLQQPSNHLDEQTLEALVDAIKRWKGTTIVVSHNRMFVESMRATHTVVIADGEQHFYAKLLTVLLACIFMSGVLLRRAQATATTATAASVAATAVVTATATATAIATAPTIAY
jgi:ABC-type protease/lipase transport system fused ATPase/permease subunit